MLPMDNVDRYFEYAKDLGITIDTKIKELDN